MPRYLVERTFPAGLSLPADGERARTAAVLDANASNGVTWVHSYITPDRHRSYCICEGPSPEAIRLAAQANDLPVDRITQVLVLEPQRKPL